MDKGRHETMSADAVAVMSSKWAKRMGLVTLAFGAFAVWCIYDAKVTYPRYNRRASAYNELVTAGETENWPGVAEKKGWKTDFESTDKNADGTVILKSSWDIGTQYVMMTLCLLVGAFALYRILAARKKTMRADDRGFLTIEGKLVPYAAIERLDLKRWQKKSIVTVHYRNHGIEQKTRIDDWIYQGGEDVLKEIQRRTGLGPETDKTAGDQTASEPTAAAAAAAATEKTTGDHNRDSG